VIDIDTTELPTAEELEAWDGQNYASALRHDLSCEQYNPSFRQLLHVAYKIAAEMGSHFLNALTEYENIIARNVSENILERHIRPVFLGDTLKP
jgi:hypothetical protein